jgi:hypothetical protein
MSIRRVGRDARNGKFLPIETANRRPATSTIERRRFPERKHRNVRRKKV